MASKSQPDPEEEAPPEATLASEAAPAEEAAVPEGPVPTYDENGASIARVVHPAPPPEE